MKRRRAFTLEFRLQVIEEAKKHNSNVIAGNKYGVGESLIRRWRQHETKLLEAKDQNRKKLRKAPNLAAVDKLVKTGQITASTLSLIHI